MADDRAAKAWVCISAKRSSRPLPPVPAAVEAAETAWREQPQRLALDDQRTHAGTGATPQGWYSAQ